MRRLRHARGSSSRSTATAVRGRTRATCLGLLAVGQARRWPVQKAVVQAQSCLARGVADQAGVVTVSSERCLVLAVAVRAQSFPERGVAGWAGVGTATTELPVHHSLVLAAAGWAQSFSVRGVAGWARVGTTASEPAAQLCLVLAAAVVALAQGCLVLVAVVWTRACRATRWAGLGPRSLVRGVAGWAGCRGRCPEPAVVGLRGLIAGEARGPAATTCSTPPQEARRPHVPPPSLRPGASWVWGGAPPAVTAGRLDPLVQVAGLAGVGVMTSLTSFWTRWRSRR